MSDRDFPTGGSQEEAARRPPPAARRRLRALAIALLLLVGGGAAAAALFQRVPVTTMPVVRGDAVEAVYGTGTVEAEDRVTVKSRLAGTVGELAVREGAAVTKGQLLARIDAPAVEHQLARGTSDSRAADAQAAASSPRLAALEAEARALEAELRTARADLADLDALAVTGATSAAERERAEARVDALSARLEARRAELASQRIELQSRAVGARALVSELASHVADADIRAPLTGVVLRRFVEPGEVVAVNAPLFVLGALERLVIECAVDEADVGRITVGTTAAVSLRAFPDAALAGTVTEILPDADRTRKAFTVKVRVPEPPPGMRSGMTAEVNFIVGTRKNALLVSAQALDEDSRVWVLDDERATARKVKVGVRDLLWVEVLDGLRDGDEVVIAGGDAVTEGSRVEAVRREPDRSAPLPSPVKSPGMPL